MRRGNRRSWHLIGEVDEGHGRECVVVDDIDTVCNKTIWRGRVRVFRSRRREVGDLGLRTFRFPARLKWNVAII